MSNRVKRNILYTGLNNNSDDDSSNDEVIFRFLAEVVYPNSSLGRRARLPQNTSTLTGNDWVGEILTGPDTSFYRCARMTKPIFHALVNEFLTRNLMHQSERARVSVVKKIMMFLRTVSHHTRQRISGEHFQHSLDTKNQGEHEVLNALVRLTPEYITPPNFNEIPFQVLNSKEFYPYFEGVVGTMDGTLITAWVPAEQQNAYRSRKATTTQNVLAICDFNMMFMYVYVGWEGSATDAHILSNAITRDHYFPWPPQGKYYLVDAGFTNYGRFLAPYRSTRYHLNEFMSSGFNARTPQELFNHRHSKLRNIIERTFGMLKSRFPILRHGMPSYTIARQVKIVIACCVLHNFIRRSGMPDEIFENNSAHYLDNENLVSNVVHATREAIEAHSDVGDAIAIVMW